MYCYTYVNQYLCVFNELQLWTHVSNEHPVFLKTVARLSKIRIPKSVEEKLNNIHQEFMNLYQQSKMLNKEQHSLEVRRIIDKFLVLDRDAIEFYPELLNYGKDNEPWKELVHHIIMEQKFMYKLMSDLKKQI